MSSESFMTKGLDQSKKMPGTTSVRPDFANRLYLPIGKGTKIVLLDDESVNIYEHGVWIQGDKNAMKMKVTCISPGSDPVPGKCRICNAMIRDDRITRKFVAYLSCIDLSKFKIEGKEYTHTRKLVPLNNPAAKRLLRRKEEIGSLKGGIFKLFRNEKTSPTVGDDWFYIKRINIPKMFMSSPRIQMLRNFYKKQGKSISAQEALKMLISPFDYQTELKPTAKKVEYFLGYIGFKNGVKSDEPEKSDYDYGEDKVGNTTSEEEDFNEEDFTDFENEEEETPPKLKKKKMKKIVKKKKKKKKSL